MIHLAKLAKKLVQEIMIGRYGYDSGKYVRSKKRFIKVGKAA